MMMYQQAPTPQPEQQQKPIPAHIIDRLEDEWRQMRENATPQPRLQSTK